MRKELYLSSHLQLFVSSYGLVHLGLQVTLLRSEIHGYSCIAYHRDV
jgi:hypothetical protein